ncbi:MAG: hypothetical protein CL424_10205 [Acidimicrobiaceae bacterium]|nr:hypothetical protein [Acidimicrobiaceae bacterium]
MVVVAKPIRFDEEDPRAMLRHLDQWARYSLGTPEAWASVLERCGQWADYSPRNQVLLASYGIVGPVAGVATWERVPSIEPGRGCAVRTGEHGLPVRVPVVDAGDVVGDRTRLAGKSESVAGSHRWEPVFAAEQLARRPAVGALAPAAVPSMSDREWGEAVRVASGRLTGRTPRSVREPAEQLGVLASRVTHGRGRVRLSDELAAQAGWLVADRVGRAEGPMPGFDPSSLLSRERWQTAVDVRRSVDRVLGAVSFAIGVELTSSPLPRHDLVDDREVPAGRRNYLAPADLRGLPLAVWVEAGPYKRAEWLARGVAGAVGVGAFMRVNDRSYLAVYETKGGAMWRLETTGRGAHLGLVGQGESDSLDAGKRDVAAALAEQFPDAAAAIDAVTTNRVVSGNFGWTALPEGRDDRTQHRVYDERITAMIAPGPGGRWQTWVAVDGEQRQGPYAPDANAARTIADGLARGALLELSAVTPSRANEMVLDLATSDASWDRDDLVAVVGHRLSDTDRHELATTEDPARLTDLLRDTGVLAPATMLHILRAEDVDVSDVYPIAATIGLPTADATRVIHQGWDVDRLTVGRELGADPHELREAGCTPVEMLAVAPREELRRLDQREHTWELVAPTLVEAGYTIAEAVRHLAAHAPTPETFAAGVAVLVDSPVEAFSLAGRYAQVEDLAALSERYLLDPTEAASVVAAACVPVDKGVGVIAARCDGDTDVTAALTARHLGLLEHETSAIMRGEPAAEVVLPAAVIAAEREPAVEHDESALSISMEPA